MQPWTDTIVEAVIDLIIVETVPVKPQPAEPRDQPPQPKVEKEGGEEESPSEVEQLKRKVEIEEMDTKPTSTSAKLAPFRRSALHFLAVLLRSAVVDTYETTAASSAQPSISLQKSASSTSGPSVINSEVAKRLRTVLGYVRVTDEDEIVRFMCKECIDLGDQLARAGLGME